MGLVGLNVLDGSPGTIRRPKLVMSDHGVIHIHYFKRDYYGLQMRLTWYMNQVFSLQDYGSQRWFQFPLYNWNYACVEHEICRFIFLFRLD